MVEQIRVRRPTDLGLAVASARHARGLTQEQLADEAGIDRTYLARLEAGLSTLLLERMLRLLRRCGADLVVLLPSEPPDGDAR